MLLDLYTQPFIYTLLLHTSSSSVDITKDATATVPAEYIELLHLCKLRLCSLYTQAA